MVFIRCISNIKMNKNKNCAQEIRQVKFLQLALPPTGPRSRLKSPNCRYTKKNKIQIFEAFARE